MRTHKAHGRRARRARGRVFRLLAPGLWAASAVLPAACSVRFGNNGSHDGAAPEDAAGDAAATCGNGQVDPGEACDGMDVNGQTCSTLGYHPGTLLCTSSCSFDVSWCGPPICGDGLCNPLDGETHLTCPGDCGWKQLDVGYNAVCGLKNDGRVFCWGDNSYGQLGVGDPDLPSSSTPMRVLDLEDVVSISAAGEPPGVHGGAHACAVKSDSTVWCWGNNDYGQLGVAPVGGKHAAPNRVLAISNVAAVSAGSAHTCALKYDGTVWCWGSHEWGQLGIGDGTGIIQNPSPCEPILCHPVPVQALTLTGVRAIRSSGHNCAIETDNNLWCWGLNDDGHLGVGDYANRNQPTLVSGIRDVAAVDPGGDHTCAVTTDGKVYCWGSNQYGQLAMPAGGSQTVPRSIDQLQIYRAVAVGAGRDHSCVVRDDGTTNCWGCNTNGELGNSSCTNSSAPVETLITGAVDLSSWRRNNCVVLPDRTAHCWGSNQYGQLGIGNRTPANPCAQMECEQGILCAQTPEQVLEPSGY